MYTFNSFNLTTQIQEIYLKLVSIPVTYLRFETKLNIFHIFITTNIIAKL